MGRVTPAKRRVVVLDTMREHEWTLEKARELAAQFGVHLATIYRDRDAVLSDLAKEQLADRGPRRADLLIRIRRTEAEARQGNQHVAVLRALSLEARITGLEEPEPIDVVADEVPDDALERLRHLYRDVHRLRRQCEMAGKATAAMQAMKQEHELLAQIHDEEIRRAELDRSGRTPEELFEELSEQIAALPDVVRLRLLAERQS